MQKTNYPSYQPSLGYMTEKIRSSYITSAIRDRTLPAAAHRMVDIVSLDASNDPSKPIQFWQLYSVLGHNRIVQIVHDFYQRVFGDDVWFKSVFVSIGDAPHHARRQSAMWLDVMGGGFKYDGAEFRLNFHHQHNALELMNKRGAERWIKLMGQTFDRSAKNMTDDPRVRISLNTFITYFVGRYERDFGFRTKRILGQTNAPVKRKLNFLNMTDADIEAIPEAELREGLRGRGVSVDKRADRSELVKLAKRL